ncbi:MAG: PucR family transcriptional regulator [Synergistales bacterium]
MFINSITVADLLKLPIMEKCTLVAGASGAERREVRRINVVDTPDIAHWMLGEEFLMTTAYVMRENPLEIKDLIIDLNNKNVSALGIKLGRFINRLPEEVLKIADDLEFPLISLPMDCSFSQVMIEVMNSLSKIRENADDTLLSDFNYQDYVAGSFLEMMVFGKGINQILQHLKTLINTEIIYMHPQKKVIYVTDENTVFYENVISKSTNEISRLFHVFDLDLTSEKYGFIVLNIDKQKTIPLSWHSSINFSKAAIVLYLQKEAAVKQTELKYKNSFLKDLMFHHIHPDDDTIDEKMAIFLGASFFPPYAVMIVDKDNIASYEEKNKTRSSDSQRSATPAREELYSRIYNFLKIHFGRIHYTTISGKMAALVSLCPDYDENIHKLEDLLQQFKRSALNDLNSSISIAIGAPVTDILDVGNSYKQAKTCIDFTRSSGVQDTFFIWTKLGIMRLLIATANNKANQEEIKSFIDQYLGRLKDLPPQESSSQIETLDVLLKHGWNLKAAAKDMHLHYNTVRYRLKALSQLIPIDLENPEARVEIYIALKLYQLNKILRVF